MADGAGGRSPRLVVVFAGLALALIGGFALGRIGGSPSVPDTGASAAANASVGAHEHPAGTAEHDHGAGSAGGPAGAGRPPAGLAVADANFRLAVDGTALTVGRAQPLRFKILDLRGRPVTDFAVVHDRPMHLIVVRRDLSGYQHLHPAMAPDGTWSVPVTLPAAGAWRAYADFTADTPDGGPAAAVLGVDLTAAGDHRPRSLPAPARRVTAGGFQVEYEGSLGTGAVQPLLFRVTAGGAPVAVEPYLGAHGHLVVLREGDLGYVHAHPEPQPIDGAIRFWLTAPSAGRYRAFFDFKVAGQVHTAEFTLAVD